MRVLATDGTPPAPASSPISGRCAFPRFEQGDEDSPRKPDSTQPVERGPHEEHMVRHMGSAGRCLDRSTGPAREDHNCIVMAQTAGEWDQIRHEAADEIENVIKVRRDDSNGIAIRGVINDCA